MLKIIQFLTVFLVAGFVPTKLIGMELKRCHIVDEVKHASNKTLLGQIIEKELATADITLTPTKRAAFLSQRTPQITLKLLNSGFDASAYGIPRAQKHDCLGFDFFGLWEGKDFSIPLTFLIYVWPSEQLALNYNSPSENGYFATSIHSHPCPCSLAVLHGTITQENYAKETASPRFVRLINQETLGVGEGSIDDLESPFIHRLICRDNSSRPCLTLHAYGAASKNELEALFMRTQDVHTYHHILREDGNFISQN